MSAESKRYLFGINIKRLILYSRTPLHASRANPVTAQPAPAYPPTYNPPPAHPVLKPPPTSTKLK